MALADRLPHTVVIERATRGARDEHGVPAEAWATLATVAGWLQPRLRREATEATEGGAVRGDHLLILLPTDVHEHDRVVVSGTDGGRLDGTYGITAVIDAAGKGHHLELECKRSEVL